MILLDIADLLQAKNLGTVGTDIFVGFMPELPDNCLCLQLSSSTPVLGLDDVVHGVQIRSRGIDTLTAYNLARGAYKALQGYLVQNGIKMFFRLDSFPEILDRDEQGRETWAFNLSVFSEM